MSAAATASRLATGSLFVFCFFLPWSIAGMQVGAAGLLIASLGFPLYERVRGETVVQPQPSLLGAPGMALALYAAWTVAISIVRAEEAAHLFRLANLWILPLFWALANAPVERKDFDRALDLLLGVAGLMGCYGVLQYLFAVDSESVFKLTFTVDPERSWWLRSHAQGFFSHALTFGGQMVLWLGLFLYRFPQLSNRLRVWAGVGIALGLIFCFQRSVWVAAVAMGAAGWFFHSWSGKKRWIALGVAVAALVTAISANKMVRWRVSEIPDLSQNNARISIWSDTMKLIAQHPIVGVGHKRYRDDIIPYREDRKIYRHAHSSYLQIWAETGLIGLGLWLAFLASLALRLHRSRDPDSDLRVGGLGLAVLGFMIMAFFEYNWGDTEALAAFLLVAAIAAPTNNTSVERAP